MGKSAQGLSLNTIVIGAIVLVVLLVLIGIFTGYFSNFVPGFKSASEQKCEGTLFSVKEYCDETTEKEVFGNFAGKVPTGQKCCKAKGCEDYSDHVCQSGAACVSLPDKPIWDDVHGYKCKDSGQVCCATTSSG